MTEETKKPRSLTDEEVDQIAESCDDGDFMRILEVWDQIDDKYPHVRRWFAETEMRIGGVGCRIIEKGETPLSARFNAILAAFSKLLTRHKVVAATTNKDDDWVKKGLEREGFVEQPDGSYVRNPASVMADKIEEWMKLAASAESELEKELTQVRDEILVQKLTTHLFAQACAQPIPVRGPDYKPDYAQVAKECHEKAKEITPYLLVELGLLPKEKE